MANHIRSLQKAMTTVVRLLKVLEPKVPGVHQRLKLNPADIEALRWLSRRSPQGEGGRVRRALRLGKPAGRPTNPSL